MTASPRAAADLARDLLLEARLVWGEQMCRRHRHRPGPETLNTSALALHGDALIVRWTRSCNRCGCLLPGHVERINV